MIKKITFPVYKTNDMSEIEISFDEKYDDEYGSWHSFKRKEWKPFLSPLHFVYDKADGLYRAVAPSGVYNQTYGSIFCYNLRNLEYVGEYDGEKFNFECPYLHTSIIELKNNDVFQLEQDYFKDKTLINRKKVELNKDQKLVFERVDKYVNPLTIVTDINDPQTRYELFGDLKVKKIGKIIIKREFVEEY